MKIVNSLAMIVCMVFFAVNLHGEIDWLAAFCAVGAIYNGLFVAGELK